MTSAREQENSGRKAQRRRADRAIAVSQRLLEARLEALYQRDARGRLLCRNQWDAGDAPRFHLMAGLHGSVCGFGADVPDEIVAGIEQHIRLHTPTPSVQAKGGWLPRVPTLAAGCVEWLQTQQRQAEPAWCGPVYRFPHPPIGLGALNAQRATVVRVTLQDVGVLLSEMADWEADVAHRQPFFAVVDADGVARAVCASVRIHPELHEAGIETVPVAQQRGYALAATTAWAKAVRDLGAEPVYSTSWHNRASLAVAGRLGLEQFAVDYWVD